jgi:hypothetical protein
MGAADHRGRRRHREIPGRLIPPDAIGARSACASIERRSIAPERPAIAIHRISKGMAPRRGADFPDPFPDIRGNSRAPLETSLQRLIAGRQTEFKSRQHPVPESFGNSPVRCRPSTPKQFPGALLPPRNCRPGTAHTGSNHRLFAGPIRSGLPSIRCRALPSICVIGRPSIRRAIARASVEFRRAPTLPVNDSLPPTGPCTYASDRSIRPCVFPTPTAGRPIAPEHPRSRP